MTTTASHEINPTQAPALTTTQQYWLDHLQKQHASGLSMAAYAKTQGMAIHTFYYWAQRLRGRQQIHEATPAPLFQPVTLVSAQPAAEPTGLAMAFRLPNRIECELRHADVRTCLEVMQSLARVSL